MTVSRRPGSAFTVRFKDEATHRALAMVAGELGVSMNYLAEEFISRELRLTGVAMEERLERTLDALRLYRGMTEDEAEREATQFATAEIAEDDPLLARRVPPSGDPYGIVATFADSVE